MMQVRGKEQRLQSGEKEQRMQARNKEHRLQERGKDQRLQSVEKDQHLQPGSLEQCLKEQGFAIVPISGTSMWPLLQEGKSRVHIVARDGMKLSKGDIVLYRRSDGTFVLHRIVKVKNDLFFLCGDHQWRPLERIQEAQILAVAQGFFRNGCYFDEKTWWYRIYKIFWNGNLTIRRCCLAFLRLSGLEKRSLK